MLRFAILKHIQGEDEAEVVLEYDENQILRRLQARLRENLIANEVIWKQWHLKKEIEGALDKAFTDLVIEFKEKTITLR